MVHRRFLSDQIVGEMQRQLEPDQDQCLEMFNKMKAAGRTEAVFRRMIRIGKKAPNQQPTFMAFLRERFPPKRGRPPRL